MSEEVRQLKSKKFKVSTDFGDYLMRKPRIHEARDLEVALKKKKGDQVFDEMGLFFAKLGLPAEVYRKLDVDLVQDLSEFLMPRKKASPS